MVSVREPVRGNGVANGSRPIEQHGGEQRGGEQRGGEQRGGEQRGGEQRGGEQRVSATVPSGAALGGSSSAGIASIFDDASLQPRRTQFNAGDRIVSSEDMAENVYVIHRGQVRLYQPGPSGSTQANSTRLIDVLGRDQWFGVAALARAPRYDCDAVAVTPTVVSAISADKLLPALLKRPDAMAEVTRDLARSVLAARAETSRLMFDDCSQRLISALLRLSTSAAATQREDGIVLHMTHSQLAQSVGAARETVSLALTQLRRQSLVRTGRNQLFFNPEQLRGQMCKGPSSSAA